MSLLGAAALAFALGIEWLFASMAVLFVSLVLLEYATAPAPRRVPPPAPAPSRPAGAVQPPQVVYVQSSSPVDFINQYVSNLVSDIQFKNSLKGELVKELKGGEKESKK